MVIVEEIAGGPVYVENDAVCKHTPSDCPEEDMEFYLPLELDFIIPNWRKVKRVELDNPKWFFEDQGYQPLGLDIFVIIPSISFLSIVFINPITPLFSMVAIFWVMHLRNML